MHELSITEALLNMACQTAAQQQAKKVTALNVKIGKLSGIIDDSVQFYWEIITKETVCKDSTLNFTHIAAKFLCHECNTVFELIDDLIPCPACGSMDLQIVQGDEFLLESIEIEKGQDE